MSAPLLRPRSHRMAKDRLELRRVASSGVPEIDFMVPAIKEVPLRFGEFFQSIHAVGSRRMGADVQDLDARTLFKSIFVTTFSPL
ncbi:MAG TPA: hypothetical protein VMW69_12130 [Spirochaetia bacterium]|nr:hypothetical protein [Spirochaetia bacterium]